jgi:hypothetical protein
MARIAETANSRILIIGYPNASFLSTVFRTRYIRIPIATTAIPAHISSSTPIVRVALPASPSRYVCIKELPIKKVINWKKNNMPTTTAILLFDITRPPWP